MKRFLHIAITLVLITSAFAGDADKPKMRYWNGGDISFNMTIGFNAMGGGLGSGGFGRTIAPGIGFGPASIFTDPAELGLIEKPMVYLDTRFDINNNSFGFDMTKTLNKSITSSTTSFLKDKSTFIFDPANPRSDSKFSQFQLGQSAQFGAFGLTIPVSPKLVLGFGVQYPFNFSSEFQMTGIRTNLVSEKKMSDQSISIDLPLNTSIATNFNYDVNALSMGAAYEVYKTETSRTIAGFSLNRYEVSEYVNFNLRVDGMMVLKGNEYHFNNPDDQNIDWAKGETNAIFWRAQGNFKTSGYGIRLSVLHKAQNFTLVAALDIVPQFSMTDENLVNESYQPKFIQGSMVSGNTDSLINMNYLSLDKPNLTVPTHNSFSKTVESSYPSSLTIGGDYRYGAFTVGLNFVKYLSDLSFKIDRYRLGKKLDFATKICVDAQFSDKVKGWGWLLIPMRGLLFADLDGFIFQLFGKQTNYKNPHYRFEAGILTGEGIAEGFNPDDAKSIKSGFATPLPTGFGLSRQYTIFEKINVGVLVIGFPDFAFRYGVAYEL